MSPDSVTTAAFKLSSLSGLSGFCDAQASFSIGSQASDVLVAGSGLPAIRLFRPSENPIKRPNSYHFTREERALKADLL
jgi:hypothetical protein